MDHVIVLDVKGFLYPDAPSYCTCQLSRKLVKGLPNHHEALSDARGAAKIMIELGRL